MSRSHIVGFVIGMASVFVVWAIMSGFSPRYEVTAGPKGVYIVNRSTGEVWIRTDVPNDWVSLGRPR